MSEVSGQPEPERETRASSGTSEGTPSGPEPVAEPKIVYGGDAEQQLRIDAARAALTMSQVGRSSEAIANTTVYVDPTDRKTLNGKTYPKSIARARFRNHPDLHDVPGPVVQLTATKRGKPRSEAEMNKTFVHETEHLAQGDRGKKEFAKGWAVIAGLTAAGAVLGERLAKGKSDSKATRLLGLIGGAIAGYQAGYTAAPHERQARQRADELQSDAVRRTHRDAE